VAFGRRVVTPLVLDFMRTHPQVQVDLSCEDAYVDIVAQGIDVSVRLGKLRDSALAARHLGENPWVTVAGPGYLRRSGRPERPADLARHNVLIYSTVFGDDTLPYSHPRQGRLPVRVSGSLRSNSLSSLLAAVRADFGVAALPMYVAAASLKEGKVQAVLSDYALPGQEIHAVFPSRRLISARVTALVDHFAQAFARPDWYAVAG
jgi:DNA-binding transcriptional LysR family regulator